MIQLATIFLGGVTSFEPPLRVASQVIQQSRFNQADIVFVTDGESHVNEHFLKSWNELKDKKGLAVLSLLLGRESVQGVEGFSDRIVRASSFEDESVYQAFEI